MKIWKNVNILRQVHFVNVITCKLKPTNNCSNNDDNVSGILNKYDKNQSDIITWLLSAD